MLRKTSRSARVLLVIIVIAAALVGAPYEAEAGTDTADLAVSATVSASCDISTSPLAFGAYDPIVTHASSPLDQAGGVSVTCTSGASATITLGQGLQADTGSTDAAPARRMIAGSDHLSYDLYSDGARTSVWGNTALTGVSHTGTGTSTDLTVYGRVPAGQNVPSGSYADTVVATVTF